MKRTILAATAVLTLGALAGGVAIAQQTRPDRALRADTDNDGRISQPEFVQGHVGRLTAVDANRDGSVSTEEMRSGIETRRNQTVSARFERVDTDANGNLSRDEFMAAHAARAEHRGRAGRRGGELAEVRGPVTIADAEARASQTFARLDTDHDGSLTASERQAARQQMRDHRQERRGERMSRRGAGQSSPSTAPSA